MILRCDRDFLQCAPCPPPDLSRHDFITHAETRNLTESEIESIVTRCNISTDPVGPPMTRPTVEVSGSSPYWQYIVIACGVAGVLVVACIIVWLIRRKQEKDKSTQSHKTSETNEGTKTERPNSTHTPYKANANRTVNGNEHSVKQETKSGKETEQETKVHIICEDSNANCLTNGRSNPTCDNSKIDNLDSTCTTNSNTDKNLKSDKSIHSNGTSHKTVNSTKRNSSPDSIPYIDENSDTSQHTEGSIPTKDNYDNGKERKSFLHSRQVSTDQTTHL